MYPTTPSFQVETHANTVMLVSFKSIPLVPKDMIYKVEKRKIKDVFARIRAMRNFEEFFFSYFD